MSSHHFVKEGQEPALAIKDVTPFSVIENALQWAPLIIVFEESIDHIISWGIKADIAIVRDDRATDVAAKLSYQMPVDIVCYPESGNAFSTLFDLLRTKDHKYLNITIDPPEKAFQLLSGLPEFSISILSNSAKWSKINNRFYQRWSFAGQTLMIHSPYPVAITGSASHSGNTINVHEDSLLTISSDEPFWVGELL